MTVKVVIEAAETSDNKKALFAHIVGGLIETEKWQQVRKILHAKYSMPIVSESSFRDFTESAELLEINIAEGRVITSKQFKAIDIIPAKPRRKKTESILTRSGRFSTEWLK